MSIKQAIAKSLFKIEVSSDLPGRLRLKIRNFKRIPGDLVRDYLPTVTKVLKMLKGVTSAELNDVTGSILISYEKDATTSEKIRTSIDKMIDVGMALYESDKDIAKKGTQEIERIFMELLKKGV